MKHIHTRTILGFCLVVIMMLHVVMPVHAATLGSLFESITNPFGKFMRSAEESVTNAIPQAPTLESIRNVEVGSLEPGAVFESVKGWVARQVSDEGGIARIVKRIGNLIADIMSYIADFLRRALELLPG